MAAGRYRQFYESSGYRRFQSVKRCDRQGIVDALLSHQGGHAFTDPATSDVVLGLTLAGTTAARWRVGAKWREIEVRRAGHIGVSPLDEDIEFDLAAPHTLLILAIDKSRLQAVDRDSRVDCIDLISVGHHAYITDPESAHYAKSIWHALETPDALTQIQVEGLVDALIGRLLVRYNGADPRAPARSEDIDLAELGAFVRENVSDRLTVAALAQVVGIEATTFGRVFKAQTGFTPYQHIQAIRIAMACDSLRCPTTSLSDLALQLGFADQSHLTRVFRRHMGMTPARYRKGIGRSDGQTGA